MQKTGKTKQTHSFGNARYIRTFDLLHKKKKEWDIKHNLAKTANKHMIRNPVSKIKIPYPKTIFKSHIQSLNCKILHKINKLLHKINKLINQII